MRLWMAIDLSNSFLNLVGSPKSGSKRALYFKRSALPRRCEFFVVGSNIPRKDIIYEGLQLAGPDYRVLEGSRSYKGQ